MSVVSNRLRQKFYLDSVELMRLSAELSAQQNVADAVLMIGTENNKRVIADAGLLTDAGRAASANDVIIAMRASDAETVDAAMASALRRLDEAALGATHTQTAHASLAAAAHAFPDANLALISTPGEYATRQARIALEQGLNVMIFSDNVALDDEIALKREAQACGLLVMGPDCGSALIGGRALAFCNAVPRGGIGVVAASGTGLQEVISLLARNGAGVSHAVGVGGRDLLDAVGGISTLTALQLLADDPATEAIVLISKPPGAGTAARVYQRMAEIDKPATVCTLGAPGVPLPAGLKAAPTLHEAVEACLCLELPCGTPPAAAAGGGAAVHGLFTGGTLCAEALAVFQSAGIPVASNVTAPAPVSEPAVHHFIDLGADEYTVGRPHPMIDPQVRSARLRGSMSDPAVGVILLDVVLGYGAHMDPAGAIAETLRTVPAQRRPLVIASVCGTDADPQHRGTQVATLQQHGVAVAGSNAEAARWALNAARDA